MIKRIICDIALVVAVFWGTWWMAVIIALAGIIIFKNYYEAVVAGLVMDSLYYIPSEKLWGNFGIFTVSSLVITLAAEKTKKQIRI